MGVFSLFRRKAKDTDEAAVTAPEPDAETEAKEPEEAKGATEGARPEAGSTSEAEPKDDAAEPAAETVDAADDVEIPKQQTADHAADNESSENARK
ncbi:hypothetical protein PV379_21570 [Streptomyces caniscabiei]|uniref:hypothetical protein n=1 Tax=Streptomyces caniscabiei TaxID=2746961 RepID=UPI0029A3F5D8|nr:hypothetical protein [Streptomyces caniscabiei]MDX2599453.1 hypothetical protein [Streptomyces caniscabiei]MDX2735252.1 hypothetical protein [Streptomyces caniscabiei]MDX2779885.1 hypothetical protein [Streptomyces caniscabiei]